MSREATRTSVVRDSMGVAVACRLPFLAVVVLAAGTASGLRML